MATLDEEKNVAQWSNAVGAISDISSVFLNAQKMALRAEQRRLQRKANQVNLERQANMLMARYLDTSGQFVAGKARAGVKVSEGDVRTNVERSAGNLAKDIQSARQLSEFSDEALRMDAERYDMASGVVGLGGAVGVGTQRYERGLAIVESYNELERLEKQYFDYVYAQPKRWTTPDDAVKIPDTINGNNWSNANNNVYGSNQLSGLIGGSGL